MVISIIALLVGILLPALGRARLAANNIKGLSQDRQIGTTIYAYAVTNNGYSPTTFGMPWDAIYDPILSTAEQFQANGEIDELARGGGNYLWSGARSSTAHTQNENPSGAVEELGLGHLIDQGYITTEFFFHPVMQESGIYWSTNAFESQIANSWHYRENLGDTSTSQSGVGAPAGAANASVAPEPTPSGNQWWQAQRNIASTVHYRNGDRSRYGESEPVPGDGSVNFNLANNLIESPDFAGKTLATNSPLENQGNRMGGVLGYTLGDGSAGHHSRSAFFGVGDRGSANVTGIVALGAADENSVPDNYLPYPGVLDVDRWIWINLQSAGYFCHQVDVELGLD